MSRNDAIVIVKTKDSKGKFRYRVIYLPCADNCPLEYIKKYVPHAKYTYDKAKALLLAHNMYKNQEYGPSIVSYDEIF